MDNNATYCQISIIGPGQFEPNMRLNEYQLKNINLYSSFNYFFGGKTSYAYDNKGITSYQAIPFCPIIATVVDNNTVKEFFTNSEFNVYRSIEEYNKADKYSNGKPSCIIEKYLSAAEVANAFKEIENTIESTNQRLGKLAERINQSLFSMYSAYIGFSKKYSIRNNQRDKEAEDYLRKLKRG